MYIDFACVDLRSCMTRTHALTNFVPWVEVLSMVIVVKFGLSCGRGTMQGYKY